jgi:hypothetical protein
MQLELPLTGIEQIDSPYIGLPSVPDRLARYVVGDEDREPGPVAQWLIDRWERRIGAALQLRKIAASEGLALLVGDE